MRDEFEEVLCLQPAYKHSGNPEMERRGDLITKIIPKELRAEIGVRTDMPDADWNVEGSGGKGNKSKVPWIRVFDPSYTTSATEGWYLVYLFSAAGDTVYLSLIQGTSRWSTSRRKFVPRPVDILEQRVNWARNTITASTDDLITDIELQTNAQQYQNGNVYAKAYQRDSIPSTRELIEDLVQMSHLLKELYEAEDNAAHIPGDEAPEVVDAELASAQAAGNVRKARSKGQGFQLSSAEKLAIERHAVKMAIKHFQDGGYKVKDVGAKKSYDLEARNDIEDLSVEVKGTTAPGGEIILTFNEVEHHHAKYPANALVVVHSIELDRSTTEPRTSGGVLIVQQPWEINDAALRPISFRYQTGIS
ncbi:MAG: DUF3578 domain-containing protein [Hyphomicrobiales bacterium]|nr:MAG: DUF3578 domain-containing protein [Hyphomicrobiales bacterium]